MSIDYERADPFEFAARFIALFDDAQDDTDHARRVMGEGAHELFLARDEGAVVGGVLCKPLRVRGRSRAAVEALVVSPRYHGKGIGRRLMEIAEEHFRGLGFEGMQVMVRADNAPARALYDALGYNPVERRLRMLKEFARDNPQESLRRNIDAIVRWTEEVWNGGKLEAVPELVCAACIRHDPGKPPTAITIPENLERIKALKAQIPDLHFVNDDLLAEADRVVARFTMTGTDPEKGEPFTFSGIEIFRLENGKIAETWSSETATGPWAPALGIG